MSARISQKAYMSISKQLPENSTSKTISDFLSLLRLGTNHSVSSYLADVDWEGIKNLAEEQGLSAVILDGVEKLPEQQRPPKVFLLGWIGEMLQGYEHRYDLYCKTITELSGFYSSHGYKMMILKGYACSLDWPKPEHRPCGDIDIWLFCKQREADELVEKEKGVMIDYGKYVHTVFNWGDIVVENHYEFFDTKRYRSLAKLEHVLEELANDSNSVEIHGAKVYVPSANLHSLFLIIHALNHFVSIGISLRQVLDWAFFVEKHTKDIDWEWLNKLVEEYHMKDFIGCLNAICIEELGFDATIFNGVQFNPMLKDRVLREILYPEYGNNLPKCLIPRLMFKLKRWRGSAWKHELCYDESRWASFRNGIWRHLMKPQTI